MNKAANYSLIIIAENIKWFRKQKGLRQVDLAESSGVQYRYLQDIEAGKKNLTLETLEKIAFGLDVNVSELINLSRLIITSHLDRFIESNRQHFENFDLAVGVRDDDARIIYCNQNYCDLYEVSSDKIIGKNLQALIAEGRDSLLRALLAFEQLGYSSITCAEIKKYRSGESIFVRGCPVALFYKDSYVGAITGVIPIDSTGHKVFANFNTSIMKLIP